MTLLSALRVFILVTGQNCTNTNLHEEINMQKKSHKG